MELVDPPDGLELLRVVAVVAERVMGAAHVNLGVATAAPLVSVHQGRHPRDVGPKRQREHLAEEPRLLAEGLRRPLGPGLVRRGVLVRRPVEGELPFELAEPRLVLVDPRAIRGGEPLRKVLGVPGDVIKQGASPLEPRAAFLG